MPAAKVYSSRPPLLPGTEASCTMQERLYFEFNYFLNFCQAFQVVLLLKEVRSRCAFFLTGPHFSYPSVKVWVQNRVSFSWKLISWLKILVQTREMGNLNLPAAQFNSKNSVNPINLWKITTLGQEEMFFLGGGGGKFSLVVFGGKVQANQVWYKLRVLGSWQHIPTQTLLKYPPGLSREGLTTRLIISQSCYIAVQQACVATSEGLNL